MANPMMGILGGFSGKVGTVVGSVRDGKPYMRAVGYKNPNKVSEKQLIQRARFALAKKVVNELLPIFEIGLRSEVGDMKMTNYAFRHLFVGEAISSSVNPQINYAKLSLSEGNLPQLHQPEFVVENRRFRVQWTTNSTFLKASNDDELYFVAIYPEIEAVIIHDEAVARGTQELVVPISPFNEATEAHCYLFLASKSTNRVSKTLYFYVPDINV